MLSFFLICNCQFESFSFLIENLLPEARVQGVDTSRPSALRMFDPALFEKQLQESDFIFVQPGGGGPWEAAEVKALFPKKTIVLGHFYFRGLHPDACYVGSVEDRFQEPSLYHSLVILDAFKRGLSEKEALSSFSFESLQRLGILDAWDSSLDELHRRDAALDFPIARLVDVFCRERQGFLTLNHPSIALVYTYLVGVFRALGFSVPVLNLAEKADPLARHDVCPVYDEIADALALPYRTTQRWMIAHLGNRFLDRAEMVQRFFAAYRKADNARLCVHSPLDLRDRLRARPGSTHLVDG